jgi:hypothetical protein
MLYLLLVKREKKKIKEMARGLFSQVRTCLAGCAAGFSQLLGAIKSCFKCKSWNFMST